MSLELLDDRSHDEPAGVWDYISPSRLNLWLKCPLAFKLRYIDHIVTPTSPAQFLGRMVHRALECFYRHQQLGIVLNAADLDCRVGEVWESAATAEKVAFSSPADERACRRQAGELVRAYLAHLAVNPEPRPRAVETRIAASLIDPATGEDLRIPLVGVIDLILDERAGPLIADFKTASRSSAPLEVSHEVQLGAYAYLVRQATGQLESGLELRQLVKTRLPQIGRYRYARRSAGHFRRLFAVIRAYLDDLDQSRFVFRPGLTCQMCEHRDNHCRRWCA